MAVGTRARLGIDIVAANKTGAAFGGVQRNLGSLTRSMNQFKFLLAGFAGGNFMAGAVRSFVEINKHVKPVGDAMTILARAWQAFALKVGSSGMNKALIDFSTRMSTMLVGVNGLANSIGSFLGGAINIMASVFEGVGRAMAFVSDNAEILKRILMGFGALLVAETVIGMAAAFVQYIRALRAASIASALFHLIQRRMLILMTGIAATIAYATGNFDKLTLAMERMWEWGAALIPTLGQGVVDAIKKMGFDVTALTTDFSQFESQLASLPPTFDELDKAVKKNSIFNTRNVLDGNLKKVKESTIALGDEFKSFFSELSQGTAPIDALISALGRLQSKLLDMALDKLFGTGQGGDAGGFLGIGGILGSLFAPAPVTAGVGPGGMGFAHFGGPRAGGGSVSPSKYYKVGEHGEEYFRPHTSGSIIPNREGGRGRTIIHNYGAQVETRERTRPDGTRDLEVFVNTAVDRRMNNPYSGASRAVGARGVPNALVRR